MENTYSDVHAEAMRDYNAQDFDGPDSADLFGATYTPPPTTCTVADLGGYDAAF